MVTLSRWMTRELSARRIQPLSGPLEASSVSMTLHLSFLLVSFSSSSMWRDFRRSESSSSSPTVGQWKVGQLHFDAAWIIDQNWQQFVNCQFMSYLSNDPKQLLLSTKKLMTY